MLPNLSNEFGLAITLPFCPNEQDLGMKKDAICMKNTQKQVVLSKKDMKRQQFFIGRLKAASNVV